MLMLVKLKNEIVSSAKVSIAVKCYCPLILAGFSVTVECGENLSMVGKCFPKCSLECLLMNQSKEMSVCARSLRTVATMSVMSFCLSPTAIFFILMVTVSRVKLSVLPLT